MPERDHRMVKIRIPTPLRSYTKNQEEVEANGATIADVLQDLDKSCPGIKSRLLDDKGALRRYINIFYNDEDIRYLDELKTAVKDGDRLAIIPAIAGGADPRQTLSPLTPSPVGKGGLNQPQRLGRPSVMVGRWH